MKRSEINLAYVEAKACFERHGWAIPPKPLWDITDFGLGKFGEFGLVLINLAEEPEYCEKLMYARKNQRTPAHTHRRKKEDIICRCGQLAIRLWPDHPDRCAPGEAFSVRVCGAPRDVRTGDVVVLNAGERITIVPGVYHEFWPETDDCIIGEVSTANDDVGDNFFVDTNIGRFPGIDEDEECRVTLCSEKGLGK